MVIQQYNIKYNHRRCPSVLHYSPWRGGDGQRRWERRALGIFGAGNYAASCLHSEDKVFYPLTVMSQENLNRPPPGAVSQLLQCGIPPRKARVVAYFLMSWTCGKECGLASLIRATIRYVRPFIDGNTRTENDK